MKRPHSLILTTVIFAFFTFHFSWSIAQSNIEKGWEHFANNRLGQAKAAFKSALSGDSKTDAQLGLMWVGAAESDESAAFRYYRDFCQTHPNPEPYMHTMWSIGRGKKSDAEMDFLHSVAEMEDGKLRAMANQAIGAHYVAINDYDEAKKYYAKTGAIANWRIVGEFENISESGFDANYAPIKHPEPEYTFTNKRGVEVKWFDLKTPRTDNWVDLEYHFYTGNSIIFAQNFCKSPKEQEVQFRLGTSGSAKVWVNDHLLFTEAEERDNDLDTYIFTAKLMAGYNRILIQLGESEIDNCNFLLRITDDKGNIIQGLTFEKAVPNYPKSYSYESQVIPDASEEFFLKKIEENPDHLVNYLILTQGFLRNDKIYPVKKVLKQAKERFPDCSFVNYHLIQMYSRDGNQTALSTYLEELKANDSKSPLAQELLYDEAIEIEDYEEAERILKEIEQREGTSENVYEKRIQIASKKQEVEEMIKLINEAYVKFPSNYDMVLMKYSVEKELKKNVSGANRVIAKYLKKNYNTNAMLLTINRYFKAGDVKNGLKEYEKLAANKPLATGYLSELSGIHFRLGNYKKAEEYVQECIKIAPYKGSYHKTLGRTYAEMDETSKALKSYDKAIKFNPYDYEARELRRNLKDEKEIFSNFEEPDVYKLYKDAPDEDAFPEDNSVVLLDEVQKVVYEGGGSEEKHMLVVKVFNSSGVDTWKEYRVSVYNNQNGQIEKAEVLKKNGSKLEAQNQGGHIVFSNLEPGDGIHLTYKVQNYYSGKLSKHFWDKHYFAYFVPVQQSRFSLLTPASQKFSYKTLNSEVEPKITEKGGNKMYVWESLNNESLKHEPYMSSLADVGPILHISSIENWDYIAEWYAGLAQAKSKDNFEVQETVKELFEGKENLSDQAIVKEIYNYIVNNIHYSSVPFLQSGLIPQKASKVLAKKQGDCKDVSTLFVSMCKAKGIDANLVLINTRDNGLEEMALPSIDFNHCIATVNLNNEDYYVELTSENLPFSSGYSSLKNTFSLVIPKNIEETVDASLINPPTRVSNNIIRSATVTFENGDMTVEKNCIKSGILAGSMRDSYEDEGEETQFKSMQEAVNGDYPNTKLLSVNFLSGLDDNADEVVYRYSYKVSSIFTEISGLSIFKLPWADNFDSPDFISRDERKFPIELWKYFYGDTYNETLEIEVPEGMKLSELPKSLSYSNKYATYNLTFELDGNIVRAVRNMQVLNDKIAPEDYLEFKDFLNKVIKADATNMAFSAL